MNERIKTMLILARQAMQRAYNPYSNFFVGACYYADNQKFYAGCNIENISYSLTLCAEAAALAQMVSDGGKRIMEVVIVADSDKIISPCGACRQRLQEFADKAAKVYLFNNRNDYQITTVGELLPGAFNSDNMGELS